MDIEKRDVLKTDDQNKMADSQQNLEPVNRENLITTAVSFLQNPKVRQSPFAQRKAFLERKGLTAEEIAVAIERSGTAGDENAVPVSAAAVQNNSVVVPMKYMPPEYAIPPVSVWTKLREIVSSAVLLTGAAYGIYHFYKVYLAPMLFGKKTTREDAFEKLSQSIGDLQKSMADVVANIVEVQRQLTDSNEQVVALIRNSATIKGTADPGFFNISDLKDEIKSVKSLLLSRNQFPPTPAVVPVIPAWQLAKTTSEIPKSSAQVAAKTESGESVETANNLPAQNGSDETQNGDKRTTAENSDGELNKTAESAENGEIPVTTSSEIQTVGLASILNGSGLRNGSDGKLLKEDSSRDLDDHVQINLTAD